ncbi:glycosyltransferase family 2 protein [Leptolyngbya sp. AN02str]|uniref:glycosyltransferase family 2 protein n=1 Tax=Leptolyngbya sp. AN02str TaxID=3423363 RepID=UPI003D3110EE
MSPQVSVIMPAYNTEQYIGRAIESVLSQTLEDIELIVVDDASTDHTVAVACSFRDRRIQVFVNEHNLGAAATRNRALQKAKGTWIAVLDSDDWYAPNRLEALLKLPQTAHADMVADDIFYVQDGEAKPRGTLLGQSGHTIHEVQRIDAIRFVETDVYGQKGLHLGFSKPLIRRQFLQDHGIRYDPALRMGQDFWFYLKCLVSGAQYYLAPNPYYYYRLRPNSLVHQSKVERLNGCCRAARSFLQMGMVRQNQALSRSLAHSLKVFERNRSYYRVVEPLKQKRFLHAAIALMQNPYFVIHFASQLNSILARRWKYYMEGDKLANETRLTNQ